MSHRAGCAPGSHAINLPASRSYPEAAMLLMGACLAVNNLVWSVIRQARVPRPVLGRVASLSNASSAALLPVGFALAGVAVDLAGAPQVFLLGGVLTALLA
jgi:DHA3 family tetracycline resistance protein-like MFS transporter